MLNTSSNTLRPSNLSEPNHSVKVLIMRAHTGVDEGRREKRGTSGRHQTHLSYGEDCKNGDDDDDDDGDDDDGDGNGNGENEKLFTSPPSPRTNEMPSKIPNLGTRLKPTPD
jgi:hypothetical protein